ncbi:MAG: TIGR00289 family protein [Methanomethylovorans sp.]|jgi:asparagine synthase (glutamine-hydrolysing)|nr:TIGR00289 family protein [Methanomethylovorans sp.]
MCGIAGFFNRENASELLLRSLKILAARGKDGVGAAGTGWLEYADVYERLHFRQENNIIGHTLHSMVNFTRQPLAYKGIFVSNCEIYNWKDLAENFQIDASNDSDLLIKLIEKKLDDDNVNFSDISQVMRNISETLELTRGVYAFAYWREGLIYIARDIIGLKPLWYSTLHGFCFASEKKALTATDCTDVKELNPREILAYDIKNKTLARHTRNFFSISPQHESTFEEMTEQVKNLLENAVAIRFPDEPFGILFSGGLDSTLLAYMCKKLGKVPGKDFKCYCAGLRDVQEPPDTEYAKKVAETLGLELVVYQIDLEQVEEYLKIVVPLVEDTNVPKVGVALTMYTACKAAKEDGMRVMFSGSGADELFAGYDRHKRSTDINRDCYADILKIYEKNTYRDDVVSMYNNIEMRVPYLDRKFVEYSLKIPAAFKINDEENKIILRRVGEKLGIPVQFAKRKKQAAQYGSRFDKAIGKLARKSGCATKTEYLKQFYQYPNLKLGVLFSSGKDSNYALYVMQQQNYAIQCLITIKSINPDSYMFHTPNIDLARLQAEAMGIPLIEQFTRGEKEKELEDLKQAILRAKQEFGIEGVVSGALYSNYQRERIEKVCDELGLKVFSPLWHTDQEKEMRQLLALGFRFIFSSVAAYGLDSKWTGRIITEDDIDKLVKLNKKLGLNVAGEGGEFESFVVDAPMYKKRIEIRESEIKELDECTAKVNIKDAVLVEK